jgi:hypothetical protein
MGGSCIPVLDTVSFHTPTNALFSTGAAQSIAGMTQQRTVKPMNLFFTSSSCLVTEHHQERGHVNPVIHDRMIRQSSKRKINAFSSFLAGRRAIGAEK